MANGTTYGINFPFRESPFGDYLDLSQLPNDEVRSDLLHLLLTNKGSRYFLPDFGTNLYKYVFEPLDGTSFDAIQQDIKNAVATYIPNLIINNISVTPATPADNSGQSVYDIANGVNFNRKIFDLDTQEHTAVIRIDYTIDDGVFATKDFIIINI